MARSRSNARTLFKWMATIAITVLVPLWAISLFLKVTAGSEHLRFGVTSGCVGGAKADDPGLLPMGWVTFDVHPMTCYWSGDETVSFPEAFHDMWVPLWMPLVLLATPGVVFITSDARTINRRARLGLCPSCGYDRTGLAQGAVCPECGKGSKL